MESAQLVLCLSLQPLQAGQLHFQALGTPLGRTQTQAQLSPFRLGLLQLDLQVAGLVQQLLLSHPGLLQARQQPLLPQARLLLQVQEFPLQVVELKGEEAFGHRGNGERQRTPSFRLAG